jgi:hypothetical protein
MCRPFWHTPRHREAASAAVAIHGEIRGLALDCFASLAMMEANKPAAVGTNPAEKLARARDDGGGGGRAGNPMMTINLPDGA